MINQKFFFEFTSYFCADSNDVNIMFWARQPPAEKNKYAKATSGVKFDFIFELSVPDFLHHKKSWKLGQNFRYF